MTRKQKRTSQDEDRRKETPSSRRPSEPESEEETVVLIRFQERGEEGMERIKQRCYSRGWCRENQLKISFRCETLRVSNLAGLKSWSQGEQTIIIIITDSSFMKELCCSPHAPIRRPPPRPASLLRVSEESHHRAVHMRERKNLHVCSPPAVCVQIKALPYGGCGRVPLSHPRQPPIIVQ